MAVRQGRGASGPGGNSGQTQPSCHCNQPQSLHHNGRVKLSGTGQIQNILNCLISIASDEQPLKNSIQRATEQSLRIHTLHNLAVYLEHIGVVEIASSGRRILWRLGLIGQCGLDPVL